jgi:hypothetical protein
VSEAHDILSRLSAIGARIDCRGERVLLRPGARRVPPELIEAARAAKAELLKMLTSANNAQLRESERLRYMEGEKPRIPAALAEGAHVAALDEHLREKTSKTLTEDAQVSAFDEPEGFCGSPVSSASKMLTSPSLRAFEQIEHLRRGWSKAKEERAAIVEHDGKIPRAWAEGFARLDANHPPGDVPAKRWLAFVNDVGRFLDSPFCAVALALGWGPYDLFGCDRDRPFARIDLAGLLWLLNGDRLIALTENSATIVTRAGARQTYRRKPDQPGQVLAWELI